MTTSSVALCAAIASVTAAGIPADVLAKLNGEINESLKSPEVRASLLSVGIEPTGGSPHDFAAVIAQQLQQWGPVAKAIRFRMD
jgi:tripartite-type tricarboxylate transporter receptor subunit TctC